MPYIDYDALESANKSLAVGFIGIFFANSVLIRKIFKKGGCLYTPKSLTMISLAIGDIFLALFSLLVYARIIFDDFNPSCATYRASVVYMYFLIHFVFGCGLIVLTAELVYRYRTQSPVGRTPKNITKSIFCSACPWILGVVVVLPITMAPCSENLTMGRQRTMYGVSVVFPAVVSFVVAVAAMCITIPTEYYFSHSVNRPSTEQTALSNGSNTNGIAIQYSATESRQNQPRIVVEKFPSPDASNVDGSQLNPSQDVSGISALPSAPSNDSNHEGQGFSVPQYQVPQYPIQQQYPPAQYPMQQQYPPAQYPVQQQYQPAQYPVQQQYPQQQYPIQQQYPQQQYPVQYTAQSNVVVGAPANPIQYGSVFPNPIKERRLLFLSTIIYCICVLPYAVYTIGTLVDDYTTTSTDIILNTTFFWLSIFRSFLTPCIFSDSPNHV
ncbi:unnamed protein product [Candidula unifasciata]|uniref:G-protein coupled receptors family 1 profile domain-containing protein n=1 Tax=Candidula unifasciata TaxID=100452 RepID=A0A8S3YME4_9EUPU|nr:unnamed protein product [Candidula unifasciata]